MEKVLSWADSDTIKIEETKVVTETVSLNTLKNKLNGMQVTKTEFNEQIDKQIADLQAEIDAYEAIPNKPKAEAKVADAQSEEIAQ